MSLPRLIQANWKRDETIAPFLFLALASKTASQTSEIPSNSLLSAENASEGIRGDIIIQANAAILLSTQIDVPRVWTVSPQTKVVMVVKLKVLQEKGRLRRSQNQELLD